MTDVQNKFWMVWRNGGSAPTVMHETKDAAITEARRLAEKKAGTLFFILEATYVVEVEVTTTVFGRVLPERAPYTEESE